MAKSERKEKVYLLCQFFSKKLYILPNRNPRTVLKEPIRTECLIKQKPRGVLALQMNIGSLTEQKDLIEEVGSSQSFFL